jgi:hypothetical protein
MYAPANCDHRDIAGIVFINYRKPRSGAIRLYGTW